MVALGDPREEQRRRPDPLRVYQAVFAGEGEHHG